MIHKHFLPFSGLPFYSFDTVFPCAKFLNFMKFNLSIFFFCCLRLWCHVQEIIAKSNVVKLLSYVFF